MDTKYLLLWLEAPLQSWGHNSRFWNRDTLPFPTKSGVYGLLLSAMGRAGTQTEILEALSNCEQEVVSYKLQSAFEKQQAFSLILTDFQMVGSGYNEKDSWENLHIPKKSDGTKAVGGGSKLTYRNYIQDGRFAVIQEVPDRYADEIVHAFHSPVFDVFLGRKNCPPSDFVFRGLHQNKEDARTEAYKIAEQKGNLAQNFEVIEDEDRERGEVLILNDIPIQFGTQKLYRDRTVTLVKTPIPTS